jgi:hypothetical protein
LRRAPAHDLFLNLIHPRRKVVGVFSSSPPGVFSSSPPGVFSSSPPTLRRWEQRLRRAPAHDLFLNLIHPRRKVVGVFSSSPPEVFSSSPPGVFSSSPPGVFSSSPPTLRRWEQRLRRAPASRSFSQSYSPTTQGRGGLQQLPARGLQQLPTDLASVGAKIEKSAGVTIFFSILFTHDARSWGSSAAPRQGSSAVPRQGSSATPHRPCVGGSKD